MVHRIGTSRLASWLAHGIGLASPLLLLTVIWAISGLPGAGAASMAEPPWSVPDIALAPNAPFPGGTCVDLESLSTGQVYSANQAFVDSAAVVFVGPFEDISGTLIYDGHATIDDNQRAGGSGLDVNANNVTLRFDFGLSLEGMLFRFGEYGGNLNIKINGSLENVQNLGDIDNQTIGGVHISVINGSGNDAGLVQLTGTIYEFAIGGQELWIDDVCPETDCVDFEGLFPGTAYPAGSNLLDSGVPMAVDPFEMSDGTVVTTGVATVDTTGNAGGWGLDMSLQSASLGFEFDYPLDNGLVFDLREPGGNVNLEVNGVFRNTEDFADVDGQVIGGARARLIDGRDGDAGRLFLFGQIAQFRVGGQELWIDNVCPGSDCVEFESLPPAGDYVVGDSFYDPDVGFDVVPFVEMDGTVNPDGHVRIGGQEMAGGTGQDIHLDNANVALDFGGIARDVSLIFGEYGGNVNVWINGDQRNIENLADFKNTKVGGVDVYVVNGTGDDKGRLILDGDVYSLIIGGQELWIDHLCFERSPFHVLLPVVSRAYSSPQ